MADDAVHRFTELWARYSTRVMAYCLRHADHDTAEEVVAEAFLIAWWRAPELPPDPLPWLLVAARHTLANQRRARHRQDRLAEDLARIERLAAPAGAAEVTAIDRANLLPPIPTPTPSSPRHLTGGTRRARQASSL